jgi:Tol biopolymer transport system component
MANSGNIYCSGIDCFLLNTGVYENRTRLQPGIKGAHPFIAPDESFLLFSAPAPGRRDPDLYVSRQQEGTWSKPEPLPALINTTGVESNPFVSPDGRYLFFIRKYDVYWADLKNLLL